MTYQELFGKWCWTVVTSWPCGAFSVHKIIGKLTVLCRLKNILGPKKFGRTWELFFFSPCNQSLHYIILIAGYSNMYFNTQNSLPLGKMKSEKLGGNSRNNSYFLILTAGEGWGVCTYQWYALFQITGAWQSKGGELTCPNATSLHTWGTILLPFPYISLTNAPYLPVVHSVWQEDMVSVEFTKNFPEIFNTTKENYIQFEWIGTRLSTNLLGQNSNDKSPTFFNICPRYALRLIQFWCPNIY